MLIWRYKPEGCTNFGDALNDYLWPRLLPPRFAEIPGAFYGIGTILGAKCPDEPKHVVFGAGAGYSAPPVMDDRWKVYFVRGPKTSGLINSMNPGRRRVPYITDPGILIHYFNPPFQKEKTIECAFMPRWDSMGPELVEGCAKAGIEVIDPRWPVELVINRIQMTKLLLTEALHGAIVADVLKVPWISIYAQRGHEIKWLDWCWSMEMIWNPIDMERFTLTWARNYAVPQLSAASVLDERKRAMDDQLSMLIDDIKDGSL